MGFNSGFKGLKEGRCEGVTWILVADGGIHNVFVWTGWCPPSVCKLWGVFQWFLPAARHRLWNRRVSWTRPEWQYECQLCDGRRSKDFRQSNLRFLFRHNCQHNKINTHIYDGCYRDQHISCSCGMAVPIHCLCLHSHRNEKRLAFTTGRSKRCELNYRHQWRAARHIVWYF